MRAWLAALLLMAAPAFAEPLPELKLLSEHPVDGMVGGNLSGLASCNGVLWTVSDRDDTVFYSLDTRNRVWLAKPQAFDIPPVPDTGLPMTLRSLAKASSLVRGGGMDWEGVTCDAEGNRYLVSEAHAAVLKVPANGPAVWLELPRELVAQARAQGMLQDFNALFEGLVIDPPGDRLWLAAERGLRGLLFAHREGDAWVCKGSCVLRVETGTDVMPPQLHGKEVAKDFSDVALFNGKLFTLERAAYRVCRRSAQTGAPERCWSFARDALVPHRLYDQAYGLSEALVVDAKGAWVGVDNNFGARADGEKRPIVWRFAAPEGGWSAP